MTIKDKASLQTEINGFADLSGITAEQLRQYLTNILDSKLLQVLNYELLAPFTNFNPPDIDENTMYLANGPVTINLPNASAGLVGRSTRAITTTADKLTLVPSGSDTIVGNQSVSGQSRVDMVITAAGEWTVLTVPLVNILAVANLGTGFYIDNVDPDNPIVSVNSEISHSFQSEGKTNEGDYLEFGTLECDDPNKGLVLPFDYTIVGISQSRRVAGTLDLSVVVDAAVVHTMTANNLKDTETGLSIAVPAGATIRVQNDAGSADKFEDGSVTLALQRTL